MECALGFALLAGNLFVMMNPLMKKENKEFMATLNDDQRKKYDAIKMERLRLFLFGTLAGLVVGGYAMYATRHIHMSDWTRTCVFVGTVMIVQFFWYMLSKKSEGSMVEFLDTKKQIREWNDIRQVSMKSYTLGLGVGLVAYSFIGHGLCRMM